MDANSLSYFRKESLTFRDKSIFPYLGLIIPYQGLIFREVKDLKTMKFVDKYLLRVSHLCPFVYNELAISGRTGGWETWNSRQAALRLTSRRTTRLSQMSLRISRLDSAYQF